MPGVFNTLSFKVEAGKHRKGKFDDFIPYYTKSVPFFKPFPNRKAINFAVGETIKQYDYASEVKLIDKPTFQEQLSEKIYKLIAERTYKPSPSSAFTIEKERWRKNS
jgi:hypothetical protein